MPARRRVRGKRGGVRRPLQTPDEDEPNVDIFTMYVIISTVFSPPIEEIDDG
jgi:hypothetical protein